MPKKNLSTAPISLQGFMITVAAVALAFFSAYSLFLLTFGILPAIVAIFVDGDPAKYLTRIVTSFNISGLMPYMIKLIFDPNAANAHATEYILDPYTWLVIYSASGTGWLIFWVFPATNALLTNFRIQIKVMELNNEMNTLVKEWGKDIQRSNQI